MEERYPINRSESLPFIYFYNEEASSALKLDTLAFYLKEKIGVKPIIRNIPKNNIDLLAYKRAKAKVINPTKEEIIEPLLAEIAYEKRRLSGNSSSEASVLYDGFKLTEIYASLLPKNEMNLKFLHIIFTNELFATLDEAKRRYHIRVAIFSFPTLISTSGVVEGPAKPREFYIKRRFGIDEFILKKEFKGRFIDYGDSRLTEVIKGYLIQALFFHLWGEPFCPDKDCRLYNSHWQEELIRSQLESPYEFCQIHQKVLDKLAIKL